MCNNINERDEKQHDLDMVVPIQYNKVQIRFIFLTLIQALSQNNIQYSRIKQPINKTTKHDGYIALFFTFLAMQNNQDFFSLSINTCEVCKVDIILKHRNLFVVFLT